MRLVSSIALSLVLAAPLGAAAQEPGAPPAVAPAAAAPQPPPALPPDGASRSVYLSVGGGLYQPRGEDEGDVFNDGLDLGAVLGVQIHPNVALEGGIGYYRASSDRVTAFDPMLGTFSAKLTLSVIPITASVRLMAPAGAVTFSALAGVGIHMADLEGEIDSAALSGSASESDTAFGFHLGGGVALRITERASVGAELRYSFAEASFTDLDVKLDGLHIGATLSFRL
jgi:opacity protein-like surface antigen